MGTMSLFELFFHYLFLENLFFCQLITMKKMELTFEYNSRQKWFQNECDMKKVFSYTDSEGYSAEIGLKKSKFKEIEKLMSSKEKREELRHIITNILSNKRKDDDCKI